MEFIYIYIYLNLLLSMSLVKSKTKVDYYEQLITNKIESSYKYKCPYDNSKFFKVLNFNDTLTDKEEFDFIVIGSGSTGAILASRLSEDKKLNILLLEAGDFEDDFSDIPFMSLYESNSERCWCYVAKTHNKGSLFPYFRGKSIGGSTAINGLVYTRGNKQDYDNWAAAGNTDWAYDKVLPYFKKLENSYVPDGHELGKSGPMPLTYTELVNISATQFYTKLFVDAAQDVNITRINNYNGLKQVGISHTQYNKLFGKRMSTGRAYIDKVKHNTNLKIITKALATKILIDKNNVAYGVKFVRNGKMYSAFARKEMIISAGVINSPQLLMLSGIGPRDHLRKHKIAIKQNLPVGKYAIEQSGVFLTVKTDYNEKVKLSKRKEIEYYLKGKGVLAGGFFFNSDIIIFHTLEKNSTQPKVEFLVFIPLPFLLTPHEQSRRLSFNKIFILSILLHPKSRGEITLKSSNPKDFPKINLGMFSEDDDVRTLYKYIKFIQNFTSTQPFKDHQSKTMHFPTLCDKLRYNDARYWKCIMKNVGEPMLHMVGSNRMGQDPKNSVVDNELKVHGVKNLRIADASVVPVSISGLPSAVCMMLGEKAADLIKTSHKIGV